MNKTEARELISKGFKSLTASSKSYQEKVHLDFIKDHLNLFIELFFYKNINISKKISFKIKKYFYKKLSFVKKYNLDFESFFLEFNDKLLSE